MTMKALLVMALAAGLAASVDQGDAHAAGGTISGKVTFAGAVPAAQKIAVPANTEQCGAEKLAQEVIVAPDKGLMYAVVSLVGVTRAAAAKATVTIDQKGCEFTPHLVAMPAGGSLEMLNSDGILHNVHTHSTANPAINKAQPGFKKKLTETFAAPEIVEITCDVHGWMQAYVVVSASGYVAVSDATGTFKLADVPAGRYKIEVWHEKLGKQAKKVTVKDGADASIAFEFQ